jgi:hypothetical protein
MLLISQRNVGTYRAQPVRNQLTLGAVGIRVERKGCVQEWEYQDIRAYFNV